MAAPDREKLKESLRKPVGQPGVPEHRAGGKGDCHMGPIIRPIE